MPHTYVFVLRSVFQQQIFLRAYFMGEFICIVTMHIKHMPLLLPLLLLLCLFFNAFHFHFHYSLQLEYQLFRVKRGNVALHALHTHGTQQLLHFLLNRGKKAAFKFHHMFHAVSATAASGGIVNVKSKSTGIIYEEAAASAAINLHLHCYCEHETEI